MNPIEEIRKRDAKLGRETTTLTKIEIADALNLVFHGDEERLFADAYNFGDNNIRYRINYHKKEGASTGKPTYASYSSCCSYHDDNDDRYEYETDPDEVAWRDNINASW